MSSFNRNSLCSASLVNRDRIFAKCSSVPSFKRFSLLLASRLLRLISSRGLSFSTWTALSSSLFLMDICSFCSPILPTMLVKASSIYAPFSTNGVTSGGVTLWIPGSLVLVDIRALILCLDVFSLSTSGSAGALLSLVFLLSPLRTSEFVIFTKSPECSDPFVVLLIVLFTPNWSMVPVSLSVYASFS